MTDINWNRLPATLRPEHLAAIYNRKVGGVKKGLQQRSPKLPTPCETRPWGVRKSDARRRQVLRRFAELLKEVA